MGFRFQPDELVAARTHLDARGFVVVERVVAPDPCAAAIDAIERFAGVDRRLPSTWYRPPLQNEGIVPLHHDPAQWAIRQDASLIAVFAALWGTDDLRVSTDRATFRAPFVDAPPLHWDRDPTIDAPRVLQGMLYLNDVPADRAPVRVAPRWYRPSAAPPSLTVADVDAADVVDLPGPRGTLVVWDARMLHGAAPNTSTAPRFAQAVTYFPPTTFTYVDDAARAADFESGALPEAWRGWAGQVYPEPGPRPSLSPRGRALVGYRRA